VDKNDLDDNELIRKISHKDVAAFRQLVEHHKNFVYSTCRSLIGNDQQAEETAQDVFFHVYDSAVNFRHQSKVSTWIYKIAVNRSLNVIRRNKRFGWIKSLNGMELEEPGGGEPDKQFENRELRRILKTAVDSLPEKQRTVFILNKSGNLSPREIADILGLSTNTVEVRLHRAKIKLQKLLSALLI
jgi:RNA polymerase sigma-70 factor (ECF subfamily)